MEYSSSQAVIEQAKSFIKLNDNSKKEAAEYLAVLAVNGNVRHCDLQCNKNCFAELNDSAGRLGLLPGKWAITKATKDDLRDFLLSDNDFKKIYETVKKRIESIRAVHEKAINFLDACSVLDGVDSHGVIDKQDAVKYLAVLAIKGSVQSSDLENLTHLSFAQLNGRARNSGLISQDGFFSNKKGIVTEEVKENLQKFFVEGSIQQRYADSFQNGLREIYDIVKRSFGVENLSPAIQDKGWKTIIDRSEDVAKVKAYLKQRAEKEFPNNAVNVYYGEPTKGSDWREPTFFVDCGNNIGGKSGFVEPYKLKHLVSELKEVFPDFKGDSSVCVLMDESGNGFSVYGKPKLLVGNIQKNDLEGYKMLGNKSRVGLG